MSILGKKSVLDGIKLEDALESEKVFHQLYTQQKQNVWFAEELNLHLDVTDYQHLSDKEKMVFQELVGYFVTTELLVQNVLGESFYPHIVSPKAKMAMTVQMFMESIHSDFFESVLNTFHMDRNRLYTVAESNPLLAKKQKIVADSADYISSQHKDIDPDSLDGKKAILYAILVNNIVQEGFFFYSAFAMFIALRESGKMTNFCNGIDLTLIDESLHMKLGIELILGILEETPEIAHDQEFVQKIQQTMIDGIELELEFLQSLFTDGVVYSLSYEEMKQYLYYIADRRFEELWFWPHYGVEKNPLKFLEKQDAVRLQNFFEVTPNQYTNF